MTGMEDRLWHSQT